MFPQTKELLNEMRSFWREIVHAIRDPYRPERHYMRGVGPKSLARNRSVFDAGDMQLIVLHVHPRRRAR